MSEQVTIPQTKDEVLAYLRERLQDTKDSGCIHQDELGAYYAPGFEEEIDALEAAIAVVERLQEPREPKFAVGDRVVSKANCHGVVTNVMNEPHYSIQYSDKHGCSGQWLRAVSESSLQTDEEQ